MSFASCFTLYIAISVVAIFVFGSDLKSDVMENVSENSDPLSYILQFLFLIISSMHIPIVLFVGKEAILIIFDECMRKTISNARENARSANIEVRAERVSSPNSAPLLCRMQWREVYALATQLFFKERKTEIHAWRTSR